MRPKYDRHRDTVELHVDAATVLQRPASRPTGDPCILGPDGRVLPSQLGAGLPNKYKSLYGNASGTPTWRSVYSAVRDENGGELPQRTYIQPAGQLSAYDDEAADATVLHYDPDAPAAHGMDPRLLPGVRSHFRATRDLIGRTTWRDRYGAHNATLSAAYSDRGILFPGPDDLHLVDSDTTGTLANSSTLVPALRDASCWLAGWLWLDSTIIRRSANPPYRALFSCSTSAGVDADDYWPLALYIDYPGVFSLFWDTTAGANVLTTFAKLIPADQPVFFAAGRVHGATSTAWLYMQTAAVGEVAGLSNPVAASGSNTVGRLLTSGDDEDATGVSMAELVLGAGRPSEAQFQAQYRRGYPERVNMRRGEFVDNDVPIRTGPTTWRLTYTPNPSTSVRFYLDGVRMTPGVDHSVAGRIVTTVSAAHDEASAIADYRILEE